MATEVAVGVYLLGRAGHLTFRESFQEVFPKPTLAITAHAVRG
jgi:hypothetical protein